MGGGFPGHRHPEAGVVPVPEGIVQAAFQHRDPNLDRQVGAAPAPSHRLFFGAVRRPITRLTIDSTAASYRRSPEAVRTSSVMSLPVPWSDVAERALASLHPQAFFPFRGFLSEVADYAFKSA